MCTFQRRNQPPEYGLANRRKLNCKMNAENQKSFNALKEKYSGLETGERKARSRDQESSHVMCH